MHFQRENERDVMRPKRKEALKFFIRELIKSWDELVEEAELTWTRQKKII